MSAASPSGRSPRSSACPKALSRSTCEPSTSLRMRVSHGGTTGPRSDGLRRRALVSAVQSEVRVYGEVVARGDIVPRPVATPIDKLLIAGRRRSRSHLKGSLLAAGLKQNRCEECGITEWRNKPLNMALHHVNRDNNDNRIENILFLCPNCHAQTPNYGGRNGHRRRRPEADAETA